jgi:Domain of unknown function (DUF4157)
MHSHSEEAKVEADHHRAAPAPAGPQIGPPALVARCKADPNAVVELQRTIGNAAVVQLLHDEDGPAAPSPVLGVVGKGGGQPLDAPLRTGMERALGVDLSDVRVHTDGAAAASAHAVQAHAYTVGNDVVFGAGQYQPGTESGQRTLAHELTHVVQQRSGPVSGTPTGTGISLSDPADSFERAAEANADRIMSGASSDLHSTASGGGTSSVQREAAPQEDEETAQGLWVQREAAPQEDEETAQGLWVQRDAAPENDEDKEPG